MTDSSQRNEEVAALIHDNRRLLDSLNSEMRARVRAEDALQSIRTLAEASAFGGWRFKVAAIVDRALGK